MNFLHLAVVFLMTQSLYGLIWSPKVAVILSVVLLICSALTLKGWKIGLKFTQITSVLVSGSIFVYAFTFQEPKWIFLGLFNLYSHYWYALWFKKNLSRSFVGSGRKWYQGKPSTIPGLRCEVEGIGPFQASLFDLNGATLYSDDDTRVEQLKKSKETNKIVFYFQNGSVTCSAEWSNINLDSKVVGVRFIETSPDHQKELGDFFEKLKGFGYEPA